jgi:hypothetical protein
MRLDPVFLVEPKPPAPSMPTRRAFLFAGSTFAVGISIGGACGYAMGAAGRSDGPSGTGSKASDQDPPLAASGDVELDELRRLATKAPIEELAQHRVAFIREFSRRYRNDQTLWKGVERLCDEVIRRPDFPDRRIAATVLAQTIELGESGLQQRLASKVPLLRTLK